MISRRKVLIVDDNEAILRLSVERLKKGNIDGIPVSSPRDALRKAKECLPDMIFLDLGMPEIGGLEVLRNIKNDLTLSDIPVVVFTGAGDDKDAHEARELGAAGFLSKTCSWEEMIRMLETVSANAASRSPREMTIPRPASPGSRFSFSNHHPAKFLWLNSTPAGVKGK